MDKRRIINAVVVYILAAALVILFLSQLLVATSALSYKACVAILLRPHVAIILAGTPLVEWLWVLAIVSIAAIAMGIFNYNKGWCCGLFVFAIGLCVWCSIGGIFAVFADSISAR